MEGKDYTCFVPVCFLVHCTFLSRTSCHLSRLPQSPQTNEFPEKPNRMRLSHMLLLQQKSDAFSFCQCISFPEKTSLESIWLVSRKSCFLEVLFRIHHKSYCMPHCTVAGQRENAADSAARHDAYEEGGGSV